MRTGSVKRGEGWIASGRRAAFSVLDADRFGETRGPRAIAHGYLLSVSSMRTGSVKQR